MEKAKYRKLVVHKSSSTLKGLIEAAKASRHERALAWSKMHVTRLLVKYAEKGREQAELRVPASMADGVLAFLKYEGFVARVVNKGHHGRSKSQIRVSLI
jgi:hypothetical protein